MNKDDDFVPKLLQYGVTVKESRGRFSYLTPDRTKPITARKLGDSFDKAAVLAALEQNALRSEHTLKTAPKWSAPQASSVGRMVDREAKRAEGKGIGYDRWASMHNLKAWSKTFMYLQEHDLLSPDKLIAAVDAAGAEIQSLICFDHGFKKLNLQSALDCQLVILLERRGRLDGQLCFSHFFRSAKSSSRLL